MELKISYYWWAFILINYNRDIDALSRFLSIISKRCETLILSDDELVIVNMYHLECIRINTL